MGTDTWAGRSSTKSATTAAWARSRQSGYFNIVIRSVRGRPSVSLRSSASLRPCASLPLQIIFSNVRLGEARSPWRSSGRLWRAGRARGQGRGQDPPPRGVRTVPSSRMRTLCLINSSGNTNNWRVTRTFWYWKYTNTNTVAMVDDDHNPRVQSRVLVYTSVCKI